MNLNKLTIAGRLTRDVELKYTPKGTAIARLGLAINRKWTQDGETKEEVTFVDVDAWGKSAEGLSKHAKKGSELFIEGRLKLDQWDDRATGQKKTRLGVVCESWQFCGGRPDGQVGARQAETPQQPAPARSAPPPDPLNGEVPEDNVPF